MLFVCCWVGLCSGLAVFRPVVAQFLGAVMRSWGPPFPTFWVVRGLGGCPIAHRCHASGAARATSHISDFGASTLDVSIWCPPRGSWRRTGVGVCCSSFWRLLLLLANSVLLVDTHDPTGVYLYSPQSIHTPFRAVPPMVMVLQVSYWLPLPFLSTFYHHVLLQSLPVFGINTLALGLIGIFHFTFATTMGVIMLPLIPCTIGYPLWHFHIIDSPCIIIF